MGEKKLIKRGPAEETIEATSDFQAVATDGDR